MCIQRTRIESFDDIYPTIKEIPDFITDKEAHHIIQISTDKLTRSHTMGEHLSNMRTSYNTFIENDDPIAKNIISRVAHLTGHPVENYEKIQVIRYTKNQEYKPHFDACDKNDSHCIDDYKRGGYRVLTLFINLNDDFEGGETVFPNINKKFTPKKNRAILFHNLTSDGSQIHQHALHGGAPIKSGTKWAANIWIRQNKFI